VPLELGLGRLARSPVEALERISAAVTKRTEAGETLSEALEGDEQVVPPGYRAIMRMGLRSGDLTAGVLAPSSYAEAIDRTRQVVRSAFFYPALLCLLAYLGMLSFLFYFIPVLEETYASLRVQPQFALQILKTLEAYRWQWVWIPPACLLAYGLWRISRKRTSGFRTFRTDTLVETPVIGETALLLSRARFAAMLSRLLKHQVPLEEALRITAATSDDANLIEGARGLAAAIKQGEFPSDEQTVAQKFPPFLRWALWQTVPATDRVQALQMAAAVYRESAERRIHRLQIVTPLVACALVGGGVTLLYGLALFAPVVDLLWALAVPQ
jgi:type II secretory pathway component PulF